MRKEKEDSLIERVVLKGGHSCHSTIPSDIEINDDDPKPFKKRKIDSNEDTEPIAEAIASNGRTVGLASTIPGLVQAGIISVEEARLSLQSIFPSLVFNRQEDVSIF